jgi:hypothetical protein
VVPRSPKNSTNKPSLQPFTEGNFTAVNDRMFEKFLRDFKASPAVESGLLILFLAVSVLPLLTGVKSLFGLGRFERAKILLDMRKVLLDTQVLTAEKGVRLPMHEERAVMREWDNLVAEPLISVPGENRYVRYLTAVLCAAIGFMLAGLGQFAVMAATARIPVGEAAKAALYVVLTVCFMVLTIAGAAKLAMRLYKGSRLCGLFAKVGGVAFVYYYLWIAVPLAARLLHLK